MVGPGQSPGNSSPLTPPHSQRINSPALFQDDHKAFRRQLEDKRPIVESNLLSGRQYVASEPSASDTSDTEGKHPVVDHPSSQQEHN